tara:strand:- start:594 stop:1541 length:948 start_codon:yes stop_codon:yes gene_type:complete
VDKIDSKILLSQKLKAKALREGFSTAGIASIPGSSRIKLRTAALQRWLKAGNHADMNWMKAERRNNIESLLEGVSSILAVGLNYYVNKEKKPNSLSIARYAWGKDYHKTIEKRLKKLGKWLEKERPDCKWKVCVDAHPLLDKAWAEEAGIGWIGKNSNLLNSNQGSWMLIGHLLCTEELIPDKPAQSLCGQCQKCLESCPTNAITEPFVVDSRLCLAYHTIENRNPRFPNKIKKSIGTWIAGCDICQDICPWNTKEMESNSEPDLQPKEWMLNLTKEDALSWTDKEWKNKLEGTALKRIKPWMWRRNAKATKIKN